MNAGFNIPSLFTRKRQNTNEENHVLCLQPKVDSSCSRTQYMFHLTKEECR